MEHPIKVVLYEDNKNVRELLADFLEQSDKLQLSKSFENANHAVAQVGELQPDVVLMDIEMPGTNGLDALQNIKAAHPGAKVIMQTMQSSEHSIFKALCRGASGYILKKDLPDQLEHAIFEVHQGGGYLSPSIISTVVKMFQRQTPA